MGTFPIMKKENHHQFNAANERIKYRYRIHIRRSLKKDEKSIIAALKHIRDFEIFIGFANFTVFNEAVADRYIVHMFNKQLSASYINDNIRILKEFLQWLERQRGYKSKINYNHIDYLNISTNQKNMAKASEYKKSYIYDQILKAIRLMAEQTIIQKRDKALISLQALSGLRISELRTIKMKNLIQEEGNYFVYVNPKDMVVKYAKTRHANFLPLTKDIMNNLLNWKDYLLKIGFKDKDPLFPRIDCKFNQFNLLESKITHEQLKSNTTIRDIFKAAFNGAGYEYIRPHSFRHTLVRFAEKQSPEFLNAVRQSLSHSSINTTFQSYGQLSETEQRNRIATLKFNFDPIK
jgi:integrase